jgi:hypothetical protein
MPTETTDASTSESQATQLAEDAALQAAEAAKAADPKDAAEDAAEEARPGDEARQDEARADPEPPNRNDRRHRYENILPGLIRRGIEKGIEASLSTLGKSVETGRETTDAVRERLQEVKLPKDVASAVGKALTEAKLPRELASAVFNQLDETKNDVLRIIAREFREFLEATDLATELKQALTSLSFEVRTEVRFIPNDAGSGVKPDVRARTRVKRDKRANKKEEATGEQEADDE